MIYAYDAWWKKSVLQYTMYMINYVSVVLHALVPPITVQFIGK